MAELVIEKNPDTELKPFRHPEVEIAGELQEENVGPSSEVCQESPSFI